MIHCKKCILPDSYPGIRFSSMGICNYCLEYEQDEPGLGKEKLLAALRAGEQSGEYDCVVPLSGGKDSTYVLYYAVKELGLRPIAVSYDSGYQTEMARDNIRTSCDTLNVPLVVIRSKGRLRESMFKQALLISYKLGSFDGPGCGNCGVMLTTSALNTAKKHGVPFILWGSASFERYIAKAKFRRSNKPTTRSGKIKHYSQRFKELKAERGNLSFLRDKALNKAKNIWRANRPPLVYDSLSFFKFMKIFPNLLVYSNLSVRQRLSMKVPLKYALHPFIGMPFPQKSIKTIFFYDYIDYKYGEQIEVLERELKWRHPPNKESRFDCHIHQLGNFRSLQLQKISEDGVNFANLVRQNLMTRETALTKEAAIQESVGKICIDIIDQVRLRPSKLKKIKHRLGLGEAA